MGYSNEGAVDEDLAMEPDAAVLTIDAASVEPRADAMPPQLDATTSPCVTETLLATVSRSLSGSFPVPVASVAMTLRSETGTSAIGLGIERSNGYSGSAEFRSSNDAQFDLVMEPLMSGAETDVRVGVHHAKSGVGSQGGTTPSASVAGLLVTMARQRITSLSLALDGKGGTAFTFDATWEFFGCSPKS